MLAVWPSATLLTSLSLLFPSSVDLQNIRILEKDLCPQGTYSLTGGGNPAETPLSTCSCIAPFLPQAFSLKRGACPCWCSSKETSMLQGLRSGTHIQGQQKGQASLHGRQLTPWLAYNGCLIKPQNCYPIGTRIRYQR